jgi:hypothetical protein
MALAAERAREAQLPPEFRGIPGEPQITRGDLAALIGVRLEPLLSTVPVRQVVVTDTSSHWAAPWITRVAATGVVEPFENHTFQPRSPVRRGDLATAVSRIVTVLGQRNAALAARISARPAIADMSPGHLSYPAVSIAVASGVMPLVDGRFEVSRAVSGAEAVATIDRLRALAAESR